MRYLGGKSKVSKDLVNSMIPYIKNQTIWIEPFVGMCNMIPRLYDNNIHFEKYILNDANPKIKILFEAFLNGWIPDQESMTKEEYNLLKNENLLTPLHCLAAFASFGGKEWGGYPQGEDRNYFKEAKNGMFRKILKLNADKIDFLDIDYKNISLEYVNEKTIIYCDPPYENTTKYTIEKETNFCHNEKHLIFEKWSELGATVFVSGFDYEFANKPQYEIIYNKPRKTNVTGKNENRDKIKNEVLVKVRNH